MSWRSRAEEEYELAENMLARALGVMHVRTDSEALDELAELLDGQEWDSDTMAAVAGIVRATGREVGDL